MEYDEDHHHRRQVIRLLDRGALMCRVEQQDATPTLGQANCANRKAEHLNRGDDQRYYIYRAVLP
jgi:hypothetical protein